MGTEVRRVGSESRYEVLVAGRLAGFAAFKDHGALLLFTHTEVDPSYEGQGLGSVLVRGALDDVRGRGERIVALCPFVRSYIERHEEYRDLVLDVPPSRVTD